MYKQIVLEHFSNPRNVGTLDDPDGFAEVQSSACGDMMEIYLKVQQGVIADIKFRTFGCAAAIASSSFTSELVLGKSLAYAEAMTDEDVSRELGLPDAKLHCSLLAVTALHKAIEDYYARHPEAHVAEAGQSTA
ncbi:MAG: iron-sulfur cluster assembly scaffold protein [Anaerolineae bacterium]|jgi:nitrogen fixation NifU-like protein